MEGMTSANFVTDTNKQPLVLILTLFFLSSGIICVLARLYTKWVVIPFVALDDYFVPVATMFMIGQSMAVTVMTTNGYGKPMEEISFAQRSTVLRAQYAAALLYIPSLFFSKISTLVILNLISPNQRLHQQLVAVAVLILAWAVTSEIVFAFQCRPLDTWDYPAGQCLDRSIFMTYFEAMNGLTDALLVLIPILVVGRVRTSINRKFHVLTVFCVRLTAIGAIITKIVLFWRESDVDPFFGTWPVTICTQLIQMLSLMSTCVLYLRPFLDALTSGFVNGDDLRRRGEIHPYFADSEEYSDGYSSGLTKANGQLGSSERTLDNRTRKPGRSKRSDNDEERLDSAMTRYPISERTREGPIGYSGTWLISRTESEKMEDQPCPTDEHPMPNRTIPVAWPLPVTDASYPTSAQDRSAQGRKSPSDNLAEPRRSIASEFERFSPDERASTMGSLQIPMRPIPLNQHGLPRVSTVYSPLEDADNIQTFLTEEELRSHIRLGQS